MMSLFLTIALALQGMFHNGGWVEINLHNKQENKVLFCIPRRYYESHTDTHGHGTLIVYDLVGSATHIVYARAYNAELEIENWTAKFKSVTESKIVRKGIREGMYWRSDAFLKESGEIEFTLYGYGKDSLEINCILDSAHIDITSEQTDIILSNCCHCGGFRQTENKESSKSEVPSDTKSNRTIPNSTCQQFFKSCIIKQVVDIQSFTGSYFPMQNIKFIDNQ